MWNFGIPYRLKHYFDVIAQAGADLRLRAGQSYFGLVTGKPSVNVYASGGVYTPGSGMDAYDLQSKYLRQLLGFMGITDLKEIYACGTAINKDGVETAKKQAVEVAATF